MRRLQELMIRDFGRSKLKELLTVRFLRLRSKIGNQEMKTMQSKINSQIPRLMRP